TPFHLSRCSLLFPLTTPPTAGISTLSLHDALPISGADRERCRWSCHQPGQSGGDGSGHQGSRRSGHSRRHGGQPAADADARGRRSEEHTSELQSRENLVCRLLLEKKKKKRRTRMTE